MKALRGACTTWLSLTCAGLSLACFINCQQNQNNATAFPFKEGSIWVYTDPYSTTPETLRCEAREEVNGNQAWKLRSTSQITRQAPDQDSFAVWLSEDGSGLKCYRGAYSTAEHRGEVSGATPFLLWPRQMVVGQTWAESIAVTLPVFRAMNGALTVLGTQILVDSGAVLATEDLTLHGKIYKDCRKLRVKFWGCKGTGKQDCGGYVYLWFKPGTGPVRMTCGSSEADTVLWRFELIGTNF